MEKEYVAYDVEYYHRTIKQVYKTYYQTVMMILIGMLVIAGLCFYLTDEKVMNGLIFALITVSLGAIINRMNHIEDLIEKVKLIEVISDFSEDDTHYFIPKERVRFSKKRSRNLMSQKRGITFFIGVRPWNVYDPVSIRYYDMLELVYTEKFKLKKNDVSFAKSRWKHRMMSWVAAVPALLLVSYMLLFRLSFIGSIVMRLYDVIRDIL